MSGYRRTLLAIDPGNVESGWALIDADTREPLEFGKTSNLELARRIDTYTDMPGALHAGQVAIEMIASYGMAVGAEVFETCVWIGRFYEAYRSGHGVEPVLIKRQPVKLHHCHSAKATDANIRQALVDRFAAGYSNHGKGTKANPSWFFGFRADVWQAYALAVYVADTELAALEVA